MKPAEKLAHLRDSLALHGLLNTIENICRAHYCTLGELLLGARSANVRATREQVVRWLYVELLLSQHTIGALLGLAPKSVRESLKRQGIKARKAGSGK